MYNLPFPDEAFDGVLVTFWFSHISKAKIHEWIDEMHRVLKPRSRIFIAENTYIPGLGGPLITKLNDENTYKLRTLKNGSQYLIIKNYFSIEELVEIFSRHIEGLSEKNIFYRNCFWWIDYEFRKI